MYGEGHVFETKEELRDAIEKRTGDDGTANTWNVSAITDMSFLFRMTEFNEDISGWDTSNVITMEGMFYNSSFAKPLPWNVSKVTNMKQMFKAGFLPSLFNYPLKWDVSNVVTMEEMFFENKTFNQPLEWKTSSLVNCKNMFNRSIYNEPLPWDVSKVENMEGMFEWSKFNQDISGWDTSSVTNMKHMFFCSVFNKPLPWVVSVVTTMEGMFHGSSFNQDISEWDVKKVTNMSHMFEYSKFNQNISKWNIENVIHMENMFSESSINIINRPPSVVFPVKEIKKKITILIDLHGSNLSTPLPDGLPFHTSLAVRPGLCSFSFKRTTTETLDRIEKIKDDYKNKSIREGNDTYAEKFQPFEDAYFEEHEAELMKESPGYTREELLTLYQEKPSPLRSIIYDRFYSYEDDDRAVIMGIFIINAQENEREVEFDYPVLDPIEPDSLTPTRSKYVKEDYIELQRRNLLNVAVANHISHGGFQKSDMTEQYTNKTHYRNLKLSDILKFFGRLEYDYVNIVDNACRGEPLVPTLRKEHSNEEHGRHALFIGINPDAGGTRRHKRTRKSLRRKVRSSKKNTKKIRRVKNKN